MACPKLQNLPPRWAHFCLGIENFITRELQTDLRGTTLLAAYSTGLDSTALLYIFHLLAPRLDLHLTAANLNHMLRPEAVREQDIARATCAKLQIPFFGESADVTAFARQKKVGLEEGARLLRYDFLERVRQKVGASYILTAHHADDLAEDVLMRIARGTGWPGLAGMQGVVPERKILRPLLKTPKKLLRAFLECMDVSWEEDHSNQDMTFLRNRVRYEILPLFLRENPAFLETINQLWKMGRADQNYWENKVGEYVGDKNTVVIPSALRTLDQALRCRIIKHTVETLGPGQALAAAIFKLDDLWQKKATGKTIQFPGDKVATITRAGIRFGKKK